MYGSSQAIAGSAGSLARHHSRVRGKGHWGVGLVAAVGSVPRISAAPGAPLACGSGSAMVPSLLAVLLNCDRGQPGLAGRVRALSGCRADWHRQRGDGQAGIDYGEALVWMNVAAASTLPGAVSL